MDTDDARRIAHELARSDSPKLASIGRKILALKTDEALLTAMKLIEQILPALTDAESVD